jgi:hypothetical protein
VCRKIKYRRNTITCVYEEKEFAKTRPPIFVPIKKKNKKQTNKLHDCLMEASFSFYNQ